MLVLISLDYIFIGCLLSTSGDTNQIISKWTSMYHFPHDVSLITRAMYDVTSCGLRV